MRQPIPDLTLTTPEGPGPQFRMGRWDVLSLPLLTGLACGFGEAINEFAFSHDQIVWSLRLFLDLLRGSLICPVALGTALSCALAVALAVGMRLSGPKVAVIACVFWCVHDCLTLISLHSGYTLRWYGKLPLSFGLAVALAAPIVRYIGSIGFPVHRLLVSLAFVAILVSAVPWALSDAAGSPGVVGPNRPNVVIVVLDTLRADHLGVYSHGRTASPNIDRFAQRGILFENAIAPASWTSPSHGSMLTGRLPYEHGANTGRSVLNMRVPTLAESLVRQGYRTAAFSANPGNFGRRNGFGRGFQRFDDWSGNRGFFIAGRICYFFREAIFFRIGAPDSRRAAPDIIRPFFHWLGQDARRPAFAFLNLVDVHSPYVRPDFRPAGPMGRLPALAAMSAGPEKADPRQTPARLRAYNDCVRYLDAEIGALFTKLEQDGYLKDTIVILTADHGESFGEHGFNSHGSTLNLELVHVPLIVWLPGQEGRGIRIQRPVSTAAIPATVMELLKTTSSALFPAPSLVPLWRSSEAASKWPPAASELAQIGKFGDFPSHLGSAESLVTPEFHYIRHSKFGEQLYRWPQDPTEAHNLAGDASLASALADLRIQLDRALHKDKPDAF